MWSKLLLSQKSLPGFPVDDVTPAKERLSGMKMAPKLEKDLRRKVLAVPDPERGIVHSSGYHPLIDAVHTAFSGHYALCLSPDAIWLTIAQGFGHHINEHAEELRVQLVSHSGKKELAAVVDGFDLDFFSEAIEQLSALIRAETDPAIHDACLCDFSTTTAAVRTASQLVLMDTYSQYFEYEIDVICGIPRICVTGSLEDWEKIRARIEIFDMFGLGWWTSRLRPLLDQFVRTAAGKPDRDFWKSIYSLRGEETNACLPPREGPSDGPVRITGWITDLFPYLGDRRNFRRNPIFETQRNPWTIAGGEGVPPGEFGTGISTVSVTITASGNSRKFDFMAGFVGIEQDRDNLSISPVITWWFAEPAPDQAR